MGRHEILQRKPKGEKNIKFKLFLEHIKLKIISKSVYYILFNMFKWRNVSF